MNCGLPFKTKSFSFVRDAQLQDEADASMRLNKTHWRDRSPATCTKAIAITKRRQDEIQVDWTLGFCNNFEPVRRATQIVIVPSILQPREPCVERQIGFDFAIIWPLDTLKPNKPNLVGFAVLRSWLDPIKRGKPGVLKLWG